MCIVLLISLNYTHIHVYYTLKVHLCMLAICQNWFIVIAIVALT